MLSLLCCGSGYRYGTVGFLARELLHAPGEAKKKKKKKKKKVLNTLGGWSPLYLSEQNGNKQELNQN